MSNETRRIACVNMKGMLNFTTDYYVDLYNETDMLHKIGNWSIDRNGVYGDGFLYEDYLSGELTEGVTFGFCYNSYPFICRYIQRVNTDFFNVHHSWQLDKEKYNRECPVCGRGVAAYLMFHCKYDEEFGVCYYDSKGKMTNQQTSFNEYLKLCRRVYYSILDAKGKTNADRWRYYKVNGDVEAINRLEAEYLKEHLTAEEQYRNTSGEIDRRFFAGQLGNVVAAYSDYVKGKMQAGSCEKEQEADKCVIDADVTMRVFGGNRSKAIEFIKSIIDKGYNATDYGRAVKKLGLNIPYGYSKKVWEMICDNDPSQKKQSCNTFNKGRYS